MLAGVAAAVDDDAVRCGRAAVEILIGMTRNTVSGGWDMAGGFNCDARKLGISLVCTAVYLNGKRYTIYRTYVCSDAVGGAGGGGR